MIDLLVKLQVYSTCDDMIEAALPALKKYGLLGKDFNSSPDINGDKKLEEIISHIENAPNESVYIFDGECIEDEGAYSTLAQGIFEYAGKRDKLIKVKSDYNYDKEKAGLAMLIDGTQVKHAWPQRDDWVTPEFMQFMDKTFENHFNKRVLSLPSTDQCQRIIMVDTEDYLPLSSLLDFGVHGHSPRELYNARLASTLFFSVSGFILFTFLGWYFLGFWWSLLASFLAWSLAAIVLVLKYAWECAEEEDAEKLKHDDPEAYGQAFVNALLSEAVKKEGGSEVGRRLKKVTELNGASS